MVDETGDVKKGTSTAGVQRQYTGTAGRIENAQVAVMHRPTRPGRAADRPRGVPAGVGRRSDRCAGRRDSRGRHIRDEAAPGPRRMLTRALDAGVPAGLGDRRRGLRRRPGPCGGCPAGPAAPAYVLAVACYYHVTITRAAGPPQRADQIVTRLPSRSWNRRSGGAGAKGERLLRLGLAADHPPPDDETTGHHWLLVRRRIRDGELAFYRCWAPHPVPLPALVRVAATRWGGRGDLPIVEGPTVGLDQPQVRRWDLLVPLHHPGHAGPRDPRRSPPLIERARRPAPAGLIPLTRNEIARLLCATLTRPAGDASHHLRWSYWRTTPPVPLPHLPLPAAIRPGPANIAPLQLADQLAYLTGDLAGLCQQHQVVAQLPSHRPAEFACPGRLVFVCLAELEIATGSVWPPRRGRMNFLEHG